MKGENLIPFVVMQIFLIFYKLQAHAKSNQSEDKVTKKLFNLNLFYIYNTRGINPCDAEVYLIALQLLRSMNKSFIMIKVVIT